jgi:hypothetical protein
MKFGAVTMSPGAMEGPLTTFGDGLGMPPELPRVHYRLEHLDHLDQRLQGCVWEIVACEVPRTEDTPAYPRVRFQHTDIELQVWYWAIWKPPRPVRAVMLWHPKKGESWSIADFQPTDGSKELLRIWRWLKATQKQAERGRPLNSGAFPTSQELLEELVPLVEASWRIKIRPTQSRIGAQLHVPVGDRRLRQLCKEAGIANWEAFIQQVKNKMNNPSNY